MQSDQLKRLQNRDETLFAELVRDHHRALIALATPIVGVNEAEEVVQNAWLKAYRAIASFKGESAIRTWLSRIVINEARMQLRSRKKELLFSEYCDPNISHDDLADHFASDGHWLHPPGEWNIDNPETLLMSDDMKNCLERLLSAMPGNQRAILEMRDTSGLSFDEICNVLSISASNARVLLHRARIQLFKMVDHYQETGEC